MARPLFKEGIGIMGDKFLDLTSLANWSWAETSMAALFFVIAVLTVRSIVERERAMTIGKDTESRRESYEQRWRSGHLTGA